MDNEAKHITEVGETRRGTSTHKFIYGKQRLVILGSGESGTGAALLAQHLGYDVFVSDKGPIKPKYKIELDAAGIDWEENQHTLDNILNANEIIKSPGIPEKTEVMQAVRAKGINVIGEIEFGWRHAGKCQIVAITGSNGKTTTTELTYHLLRTAGLDVRKGGNVGNSFARMVLDDIRQKQTANSQRLFVLEMSSFQLDDIQQFRPKVAMLLNITPDHLDRYEYALEQYAAAKFRVTMNQRRGDKFIYNGFDPILKDNWTDTAANKIAIRKGFFKNGVIRVPIRPTDKSVGWGNSDGTLESADPSAHRFICGDIRGVHGNHVDFDTTRGNLRGPHNMFNAACAIRTALLLGADTGKIQEGLDTFVTPPHRLEKVAEVNGVTYINDSKATNVDSVFYALQAMDAPTVWIVGGTDKGNDYTPLLKLVKKKVKAIVCMGVDNSKIVSVFGKMKKPMVDTRSAVEAVKAAALLANAGDTVLLSPACASFDLFKNYEDRGAQFREAVLGMNTKIVFSRDYSEACKNITNQTPDSLISDWEEKVKEILRGYDFVPPELTNDMCSRRCIEDTLKSTLLQEFEDHRRFRYEIKVLDNLFMGVSMINPAWADREEDYLWGNRILKYSGKEYADFMNAHLKKGGLKVLTIPVQYPDPIDHENLKFIN